MASNLSRSFYLNGLYNFDEICRILFEFYGYDDLKRELLNRIT